MITGKINIYEVEVDGPPKETGSYFLWLIDGSAILYIITDIDLDQFEDNFDGFSWLLNDEKIIAYISLQEFNDDLF